MTMAISVAQLWCGPCAFKWCLDWSKAERCLFIVSCVQWVIREGTRPYFSVHKCLEDHRLLAVSFFIISLVFHHQPGLMIISTVSLIDNLISLTFLGSESKMSLFSRQSKLDSGWRGSIEHKVLQKSTTWEDLQKEWRTFWRQPNCHHKNYFSQFQQLHYLFEQLNLHLSWPNTFVNVKAILLSLQYFQKKFFEAVVYCVYTGFRLLYF